MSQPITLNVSPEFVALGSAISGLVSDIKAGKTIAQDVEDAVTQLIGAVGSVSAIANDLKAPENQAYLSYCLLKALEPAVVQS